MFRNNNKRGLSHCPICNSSSQESEFTIAIYGGRYHQCRNCSHYYIYNRPSVKSMNRFYSLNKSYSSIYTDKKSADLRVNAVVMPKLNYTIMQYKKEYDCRPQSILDVGSGGGHFVYAGRKAGIKTDGIELSKSSRNFCRNVFGFELQNVNFLKKNSLFHNIDIVTLKS